MKKTILLSLLLACTLLFTGCGLFTAAPVEQLPEAEQLPQAEQPQGSSMTQIANPWKDYESLAAATKAAAYPYELPEVIAGCTAEVFRVMNGELLEVRYSLDDTTLTLRYSAEENADISGVYADFTEALIVDYADGSTTHSRTEDGAELILFHFMDRGSWSLYAPTGFPEGVAAVFTEVILGRI